MNEPIIAHHCPCCQRHAGLLTAHAEGAAQDALLICDLRADRESLHVTLVEAIGVLRAVTMERNRYRDQLRESIDRARIDRRAA